MSLCQLLKLATRKSRLAAASSSRMHRYSTLGNRDFEGPSSPVGYGIGLDRRPPMSQPCPPRAAVQVDRCSRRHLGLRADSQTVLPLRELLFPITPHRMCLL